MIKFDKSLRSYFHQLACLCSLSLPIFYSLRCRLEKNTSPANLIIDQFHRNYDIYDEENIPTNSETFYNYSSKKQIDQVEDYIQKKVLENGINSTGLCKFCSTFNIDLSNLSLKPGYKIDKLIKKLVKANEEYSKIITSLNISNFSNSEPDNFTVSLNKNIFKHLPNLSNLSIRNVNIKVLETRECFNLKNIEFVNNNLTDLPNEMPLITQIIVDNNPIKKIPENLFAIESLRSLILSRLNIEDLPDGWLTLCTDNICNIRSVHIAQTKLRLLPNDLIVGNKSLEQLIFQGIVFLINS